MGAIIRSNFTGFLVFTTPSGFFLSFWCIDRQEKKIPGKYKDIMWKIIFKEQRRGINFRKQNCKNLSKGDPCIAQIHSPTANTCIRNAQVYYLKSHPFSPYR